MIVSVDPQEKIDVIDHIGPYHGNFIDDHGIEFLIDPCLAYPSDISRVDEFGRKPEEGMDGLAPDVQRGNAGRGQHDHILSRGVPEQLQQGRFASPGTPRHKKMVPAVFQPVDDVPVFGTKNYGGLSKDIKGV
jgi:hypothetical protein